MVGTSFGAGCLVGHVPQGSVAGKNGNAIHVTGHRLAAKARPENPYAMPAAISHLRVQVTSHCRAMYRDLDERLWNKSQRGHS